MKMNHKKVKVTFSGKDQKGWVKEKKEVDAYY